MHNLNLFVIKSDTLQLIVA